MNKKLTSKLYYLAGLLFGIASILTKNNIYIPLGFCFITLGIVESKKEKY